MTWGFLTFGAASQGLILNNYATSDPLAFIARLGIGCSIIFSYPINFIGLREGVLGLLGATGESDTTHVVSTVLLLAVACGISMMTKNLGLVVALGGALVVEPQPRRRVEGPRPEERVVGVLQPRVGLIHTGQTPALVLGPSPAQARRADPMGVARRD